MAIYSEYLSTDFIMTKFLRVLVDFSVQKTQIWNLNLFSRFPFYTIYESTIITKGLTEIVIFVCFQPTLIHNPNILKGEIYKGKNDRPYS